MSENRRFGFLMASVLAALSAWRMFRHGEVSLLLVALTGFFFSFAILAPGVLTLPRKYWLKLGDAMHVITQPIVLGVIYFVVLTPTGFVRRRFGFSKLALRPADGESYWRLVDKKIDEADLRKQF